MITFLKIAWPAFALIALLGLLWWWGEHRESQGREAERVEWEAETARLRAVAVDEAFQRQAAVNGADTAARAAATALEALAADTATERDKFYESNPDSNRLCLDDARLRAIAESDRKAIAAAGAAVGVPEVVHNTPADRR